MITIGITGSIASGKSTVAKLIAKKKYPLFSADKIVLNLYKSNKLTKLLIKKFKLSNKKKIKNQVRLLIKKNKSNLRLLEAIIHPLVREKMIIFLKKKQKILVLEIPLLVESKLNQYFDKTIFVNTGKQKRLKRYLKENNDKKKFEILNKRQLSPLIKKKICDFTINNNYTLAILKKNVKKFMKIYE
jgi:dephospho-CoA kinase